MNGYTQGKQALLLTLKQQIRKVYMWAVDFYRRHKDNGNLELGKVVVAGWLLLLLYGRYSYAG